MAFGDGDLTADFGAVIEITFQLSKYRYSSRKRADVLYSTGYPFENMVPTGTQGGQSYATQEGYS